MCTYQSIDVGAHEEGGDTCTSRLQAQCAIAALTSNYSINNLGFSWLTSNLVTIISKDVIFDKITVF